MVPEPAVAVTAPPHVSVKPFGVATTTPAGKLSIKVRPVTATPSLFVILKVSVEMPPGTILFGVKLLLKLGAGTAATNVAVAAAPVGRPVAVIVVVTLVNVAAISVWTFRLRVQLAPAARLGIVMLTEVEPAEAPATVVPAGQLVVRPGAAATARPAGRVSLNAIPVAAAEFGFETVNVRVELPGAKIGFGLNAFDRFRGNKMVTLADAGPSRLK
jgi:hypothetical protein